MIQIRTRALPRVVVIVKTWEFATNSWKTSVELVIVD